MNHDAETRCQPEVRVRRNADGARIIHGYAAVFNSWSVDLGGFIERIQPGAFSRVISGRQDVRALVSHDTALVLGRTKSGTLRILEDERGLAFELDAPPGPIGEHYANAVERGDMDGMSFRFVAKKDAWDYDANPVQRELIDVDIDEISLVAYPAYPDTSAAIRSLEAHRRTQPLRTPRRDRAARRLRLAMAEIGPPLGRLPR
jgi:HK97 family phage prohead protease